MEQPPPCNHPRVHFGSGGFYIFCQTCYACWLAVDKSHKPDYDRKTALAGAGEFEFKLRPPPLAPMKVTIRLRKR